MLVPEVSVVIPAYNAAKYIEKAIASVFKQNVSLEIIVINDGSSDNLDSVISEYKNLNNFVYIKNASNLGVAESRNIGVRVAKGDYIAFLDADDWWRENKLREQLNIIKEKKCVLCYTGRELADKEGKLTGNIIHTKKVVNYNKLLFHNTIACSSVLVKTDIALEIPMKNDEYHEDYLTWLMILKKYGTAYGIDKPLMVYTLSQNSKSRNKISSAKKTFNVYRILGYGRMKSILFMSSHILHSLIQYYLKNK